jgi:hypothetical protein
MSERALPAFAELIGPRQDRAKDLPTLVLGFILIIVALVAAETALGLVFDPRGRDFQFAGLTMIAVPVWLVALLGKGGAERPRASEAIFACLLAAAAVFILLNEGPRNWQSLWTSADYVLLGSALCPPRLALAQSVIAVSKLIGYQRAVTVPVAPPPAQTGAAGVTRRGVAG